MTRLLKAGLLLSIGLHLLMFLNLRWSPKIQPEFSGKLLLKGDVMSLKKFLFLIMFRIHQIPNLTRLNLCI